MTKAHILVQPLSETLNEALGEARGSAVLRRMAKAGLPAEFNGDLVFISTQTLMMEQRLTAREMTKLQRVTRGLSLPPIGALSGVWAWEKEALSDPKTRKAFFTQNTDELDPRMSQHQMKQADAFSEVSRAATDAFEKVAKKEGYDPSGMMYGLNWAMATLMEEAQMHLRVLKAHTSLKKK